MNPIIFATNNPHKLDEIKAMTNGKLQIISLQEAGISTEIDEPWFTFRENAQHKCEAIYRLTGLDCFADDSGLETDALNGEPGVRSARFAGEPVNHEANIELLLQRLGHSPVRTARFRTVICYLKNGVPFFFEGICEGNITYKKMGTNGFGYDPVFVPIGYAHTFAEMEASLKNTMSHRKKAFDKLVLFLTTNS
jgi:XTP/dITP diphosphohydrolase